MRPSRCGPRSALAATPHLLGVPAEATIRRTLARLDAAAVGAWLAERDRKRPRPAASRRRAVTVDGKTLRGVRGAGADGRRAHLLACMDHATRAVLAQRQVGGAPAHRLQGPAVGEAGASRPKAGSAPPPQSASR